MSILAARDALEAVSPPKDARKLHAELLQLYDLNASLGLEVITLQQFLPGVRNVLGNLADVNKSYRQNLSGSTTATAQANALDSYSTAVRKVVDRFRGLGRRRRFDPGSAHRSCGCSRSSIPDTPWPLPYASGTATGRRR